MDAKLYDLNICEHFLVMIKNEDGSDVNEDGDFIGRRINLQHQLVAPLTNDSTRSLCLVTGVVHLAATATLTGQIKESGSESGSCMV